MVLQNENDKPSNKCSLQIIDISSDSESDAPSQHPSKFGFLSGEENNCHGSRSTWSSNNDVIELTDSEDSSSDLPDLLSPSIKGLRGGKSAGSRQRQSSKEYTTLYVNTSDDEELDKDCILVLNDSPDSRRPTRTASPAKGQVVSKPDPLLNSSKKNLVPEPSQVALQSLGKRTRRSAEKTKEQVRRQRYATELFAELNRNVFGNRLPKGTAIEWNKRLLTTAGRAHWHRSHEGEHTTKIELASKIVDCDERVRNTLSHEMCHLACWVIDNQPREGHGSIFKSWATKVMVKRPDIHISTRHTYEISYPYEWKCEKCEKTYGRYSKSIRPDECVCGSCKAGKLIPLFVERKAKTFKVSRMAVATPPDSLPSMARDVYKDSVARRTPSSTDERDMSGLLNALGRVSVNSSSD